MPAMVSGAENDLRLLPAERYRRFSGRPAASDIFWCSHWDDPRAPRILHGEEADSRALEGRVNKFVCIEQDSEKLHALGRLLETLPGLEITSSWADNYELMPRGVSQGPHRAGAGGADGHRAGSGDDAGRF